MITQVRGTPRPAQYKSTDNKSLKRKADNQEHDTSFPYGVWQQQHR